MKKLSLILSFLMAALLFFSCEKQDLPTVSNELTLKEVRRTRQGYDVLRRASFGEDGKIQEVVLGNLSTSEFDVLHAEFIYNDDNLLECIPVLGPSDLPGCFPALIYSNGILTNLNGHAVAYEGRTIIEDIPLGDKKTVYEFEDDSYNRLLKIDWIKDVSTNPTVYSQEVFEYENNNLVSIATNRWNDATDQLEPAYFTEYTYDDKINPYQQTHKQIALISYFQRMLDLNWNQFNLRFRSANNVTSIFHANYLDDHQQFRSFTYEYNSLGYPIQRVHPFNGSDIIIKYNYYD